MRQLRHGQRCYTYLLPLYTSLTIKYRCVPLSQACSRTYSRLSTHIHTQTRRSPTCLTSQPCASRAWRRGAVSMCLRGCRGTRRAPLGHAAGGRGKVEPAQPEWTRSRRWHGWLLHAAVPRTQTVLACIIEGTVPCASCSGCSHHASPSSAVRPRVTSDIGE